MSAPFAGDPAARLASVVDGLARAELDALLVTNLVDVRWLTGFQGSNGAVLVGVDWQVFLTDFRYVTQIAGEVAGDYASEIGNDLTALVAAVSQRHGVARLGFHEREMTVRGHQELTEKAAGVTLVSAGEIVTALRAVKDPAEIERIQAATALADAAFSEVVLHGGVVGRTERELALELEMAMRSLGAQGISFPPIVAAGAHGALPHAVPRDVPIPADTLVVIDWGAHLDGYASDCTRTVATGTLSDEARETYELVLTAERAALASVSPGLTGAEVDAVARDIIEAAGHGDHFGHGLGHGVGLEVHEGPRLSKLGTTPLVAGNVVTVEPGVYLPGRVGVRIEDLVAITADGHEVLTSLTTELTRVE